MLSDFYPALSRGITDHCLYEFEQQPDYIGAMFHEAPMDGAYEDYVTWEGLGLPQEHFPTQRVNLDGIRPSYGYRILARSWTIGFVISIEDQQDDLYSIIHKMLPMQGGEVARSYYALEQILGAQFFGLYGYQAGTSVPFAADGLSFFNTAHPISLSNQSTTVANTTSVAADLSIATAQIMRAALRTQPRPNGIQKIPNKLRRVMVHTQEELVAKQIFQYGEREVGTADNNRNYLADDNVDIVVNPYFEYSGTAGAAASPVAYNRCVGQGDTHYCMWRTRSDLKTYSRFDNTVFADVVTFMKRFGFGILDWRGTFGLSGL